MECSNLLRICFDPILRYYKAEKLARGDLEGTFIGIELYVETPQYHKDLFEVSNMVLVALLLMSMSSIPTFIFYPIYPLKTLLTSLW